MAAKILFVYINKFKDYPILYEYCTLLQSKGHKVFYVGLGDIEETFLDTSGVNVTHLSRGDIKSAFHVASKVNMYIKKINPDLIHVFHFRWCFLLPVFSRFSYKFLLDVRTVHIANKEGKHSLLSPLKNRLTWFESLFYKHCIALTPGIKKILTPSRASIPIIPLGANPSNFRSLNDSSERKRIKEKFDIENDKIVFLYSGTLCPTRNINLLIKAFKEVTLRAENVHLIVVGDHKDNPNTIKGLIRLTEELSLVNSITFTGFIEFDKLIHYYQVSDIGLCYIPQVPYYDEQPPTKLFEYIAAGLIVIGTRTTAIKQVMVDEVNGYLANDTIDDFSASMNKALSLNSNDRTRMIESANDTLEKYNWKYIIDTYLYPYYKAIGIS
jgi:glycosyltransferase involved in cell wall biosynthesis